VSDICKLKSKNLFLFLKIGFSSPWWALADVNYGGVMQLMPTSVVDCQNKPPSDEHNTVTGEGHGGVTRYLTFGAGIDQWTVHAWTHGEMIPCRKKNKANGTQASSERDRPLTLTLTLTLARTLKATKIQNDT